jgi:tRNA(fMet)-specific endonuclease VapC
MLILDTDHLSEMDRRSVTGLALLQRLRSADHDVATTVISIDEQLRGLLALVKSAKSAKASIPLYARLEVFVTDLARWDIMPFDDRAVNEFEQLRKQRLGIGTMDLKIAAIALAHDATLLSRNLKDYTRVPNLRTENWLE